ncbi:MAG TPA: RNA 2',3'-cyclic phosphodiesterase [Solirubrobacteraceae bacterium]|jgi:2'-5' RNA ligase
MPRTATARLFLAIDPPARTREQLAAWARGALGPGRGRGATRPLRLLHPDLLHLTICFLGARPVADVERIAPVLDEFATSVGELTVGAPLWLPPRRPRTLAVELHDPSGDLARLHEVLSAAIADATGWVPEAGTDGSRARVKRLRPHITLARMRNGAAGRDRELPPTPALAFTPTDLVLYRSWLDPEGAAYEPLVSVALVPA